MNTVVAMLAAPQAQSDVIIVGAGWAGMSAARTLAIANVSFTVLEAREYTGGRTHAMQFGDPSVGKFTMELGSGWLEGSGDSGGPEKEPPLISSLAEKMGLKTAFVPGSTQNMSNYKKVFTPDGAEADIDGKIRQAATAAYACIGKAAKHKGNPTVREALSTCGWNPQTNIEKAVDWALTVDDPGLPAEIQALKLTLPDPVYEWWGPNDRFIIDQSPRGYASVMDFMMADLLPLGDPRLILNTKVTNINYTDYGVVVSTANGTTYSSSVVISTIPLGVLNRHHRTLFTPTLPQDIATIIDGGNFIMSNLTRIYLQFPTVFWDNSIDKWLAADDQDSPGEFPEFINLNHLGRVPGSQTLLLFLGNPESVKYESMDDASVQKAVMRKLKRLYPSQTVPEPVAFHITRWGLDELAYGCYSAFLPEFDDDGYETLNTPIKVNREPRVYLAGEAFCDDLSGSTYGAFQSGRQMAETWLHYTGRQPHKPKDICWW